MRIFKKINEYYKRCPDAVSLVFSFLFVIIVYWPVYRFKFLIGWDDQWAVINFYTQGGFNWSNIYTVLSIFYGGQYAPINQFYYTGVYYFFGYDPMYYHISNVFIHLINIVLIYYLLKKVISRLLNNSDINPQYVVSLTTLLFAISPLNTEPVAWISAAKVIIYALFYLLSLHCYCKYLETKKSRYFYLTLFLFLVSFGAKEQAVTLPICLLLFDYLYNRNLKEKLIWLEKLPFFIIAFLFGYISIQSQGKELFETINFYPFYQRVILAFYTLSEYFVKTVAPINLSYLYPFPFQIGDAMPLYLWIYPVAIIIFMLAYYREWINNKWLVFSSLFFIIHLLFVINLMSLSRFSVVADRYAYIATIGLYLIFAILFVKALKNKVLKKYIAGFGLLYVLYFMSYAHVHIYTWTNAFTLKSHLKKVIRSRSDFEQWKIKMKDK